MLGFVQNWFSAKANPIGVDWGADCLRMAQVQQSGAEPRLVAAASCDVPEHVRQDTAAGLSWFSQTVRDLLSQGKFHGRQAVLSLPSSWMHIRHLRMARLDEETLVKALPWELKGKLPIDPSAALLRHVVAGEIHNDQAPQSEVIVMAAARELIEQFLAAAARAKLDVVGMNVQPKAVVDCFGHIYRRKTDAQSTTCFVDIGHCGTRAVIAREGRIVFARMIPIGARQFNEAVASAMNIDLAAARLMRIKQGHESAAAPQQPCAEGPIEIAADAGEQSMALLEAGMRQSEAHAGGEPSTAPSEQRRVEQAVMEPLNRLAEELDLCRRYYEGAFGDRPVDRLVFIGGEARQRVQCQRIARHLSLAAQVGDPLVRMNRTSDVSVESGIDRREPQPAWTIAVGLSLGCVPEEARRA